MFYKHNSFSGRLSSSEPFKAYQPQVNYVNSYIFVLKYLNLTEQFDKLIFRTQATSMITNIYLYIILIHFLFRYVMYNYVQTKYNYLILII